MAKKLILVTPQSSNAANKELGGNPNQDALIRYIPNDCKVVYVPSGVAIKRYPLEGSGSKPKKPIPATFSTRSLGW